MLGSTVNTCVSLRSSPVFHPFHMKVFHELAVTCAAGWGAIVAASLQLSEVIIVRVEEDVFSELFDLDQYWDGFARAW